MTFYRVAIAANRLGYEQPLFHRTGQRRHNISIAGS